MKSFKQYLREFAQRSPSELIFDVSSMGPSSSALRIPISAPMFKRIWPDTIRTTVFHATDLEGLKRLKKLEGGKRTISAFFSMMSSYMESGIATGGGIVAEMDADVLVSARDDIMSEVDTQGRRWVEMSWFANATRTGPKFDKVEKDLNLLIKYLVSKHLTSILGKSEVNKRWHEYNLWQDMKRHLKGDGQKLRLVIKDYFDGVEKILKKNKKVMGDIFYGYTKSKRMTDNEWDEQIVNNIDIYKIHILRNLYLDDEDIEDLKDEVSWPVKVWDASIELEIYTRKVVNAEIRTMA